MVPVQTLIDSVLVIPETVLGLKDKTAGRLPVDQDVVFELPAGRLAGWVAFGSEDAVADQADVGLGNELDSVPL